jgi:speckle-type POZ protein
LESYLLIQDDDYCRIRCDVTVIREPPAVPPPSDLGDLLLASEVGRDVTFVVDGEQFTAHRCVLAARSSTAFMAEVLAGKESTGSRHVRVNGMAPSVFRALLHFIYTDSLPVVQDEEEDLDVRVGFARALLEAADRYDMERLKMICTDVLCNNIYAGTALPTLQLSQAQPGMRRVH